MPCGEDTYPQIRFSVETLTLRFVSLKISSERRVKSAGVLSDWLNFTDTISLRVFKSVSSTFIFLKFECKLSGKD